MAKTPRDANKGQSRKRGKSRRASQDTSAVDNPQDPSLNADEATSEADVIDDPPTRHRSSVPSPPSRRGNRRPSSAPPLRASAGSERPSEPATPAARRSAVPQVPPAPPLPAFGEANSDEATREISLDAEAMLDPEGDDDDYTKTPIASIKSVGSVIRPELASALSLPPAPSAPSSVAGPRRPTMVGFPAPPAAGASAFGSAPVPSKPSLPPAPSALRSGSSLPPMPTPPRSSAPPAHPSAPSRPSVPGSLPMPAPPRSSVPPSVPSVLPPPPIPPASSSVSAPGARPSAAGSLLRGGLLPAAPSSASRAPVPPPAPPLRSSAPPADDARASAVVYSAPAPPPPPHKPSLPVNSVYDESEDDEVTTVFSAGSEAAQRLGAAVGPRAITTRPPGPLPTGQTVPPVAPPALKPLVSRPPAPVSMPAPAARPQPTPSAVSYPPAELGRRGGAGKAVLWIAGLGGFAAAAAVLFYLLFPSSGNLMVTVTAPGALPIAGLNVYVDGQQRCSQSPCSVNELTPGSHLVRAVAKGFEPTADQAVVVLGGRDVAHNFTLTPLPPETAELQVAAGTLPIKVFIDGEAHGTLPLSLQGLEPREYTLRFEADSRYEKKEQRVTLVAGETTKVDAVELPLLIGKLKLSLPKALRAAKVTLDGKIVKKLPAEFELDGREKHVVEATLRGYEDYQREISFDAAAPEQEIAIELERPTAVARVNAPAPARSSSTPAQRSFTASTAPAPAPAEEVGYGTLNLNSIPSATAIVNGQTVGRTPRMGLKVKAGAQSIVFVHPEKGRKQTRVTVPAGDTKTVAVRF